MISLFLLLVLSFFVVGCKEVTYSQSDAQNIEYVELDGEPRAQYVPQNARMVKIATIRLDGDWSDVGYLKNTIQVVDNNQSTPSEVAYSVERVVYDRASDRTYTLIGVLVTFRDYSPQLHSFRLMDMNPDDRVYVLRQDIGVVYTTSYRISPPSVNVQASLLLQNEKLGTIRIRNVENTELTISAITLDINNHSTRGSLIFHGLICLRDLYVNSSCGNSTISSQSIDHFGGKFAFTLDRVIPPGGYIDLEVYIDGAPLWVTGDSVLFGVSDVYMPYTSASYTGVAGASATATK